MNTNTDRGTTRVTSKVGARRAAALSVAGVVAGLALAPTSALAVHPAPEGGGSATPSGVEYSHMYDVAQRREAMARVQATNDEQAGSDGSETSTGPVNTWSYMYTVDEPEEQVVRSQIPPAKVSYDSVVQRKAHPALASIVVSVTRSAPATCYLPDTVDAETRRLIAVQLCSKASIVPAVFLARAATYEPAVYSLGHL